MDIENLKNSKVSCTNRPILSRIPRLLVKSPQKVLETVCSTTASSPMSSRPVKKPTFSQSNNHSSETPAPTSSKKPSFLAQNHHETLQTLETFASSDPYELNFDQDVPSLEWCAYCKADLKTEVIYKNTSKTFWTSLGIFALGGVFGCCFIPYTLKSCKDCRIVCSKCKHTLR